MPRTSLPMSSPCAPLRLSSDENEPIRQKFAQKATSAAKKRSPVNRYGRNASELAVAQHVVAVRRGLVHEEARRPVGIRRELRTARVRVHRHRKIAEAED